MPWSAASDLMSQYAATACWAAAFILGASLSLLCLRLRRFLIFPSMPEGLRCLSPASSLRDCPASPACVAMCQQPMDSHSQLDHLRAAVSSTIYFIHLCLCSGSALLNMQLPPMPSCPPIVHMSATSLL